MAPSILSQSVAVLARATYPLQVEDSLGLASRRMRESGTGIVPLVDNGRYAGAITERSLAEALASGLEPLDAATAAREKTELRVGPFATGAEALRLFSELSVPALVVVDDAGRLLGTLSPSDLYPRYTPPPRPSMIGGMATPFGVYLTTGSIRAGASDLALVTTGMLIFCLFTAATIAGTFLMAKIPGLRSDVSDLLGLVVVLALFGIGLRLVRLTGIHAAEHKVVHAIERGEDLTPEIVKRMPRAHPRCGTNFAVGAVLFVTLSTTPFITDQLLRPVIALMATLIFWRPLGTLAQTFVTTSPPSERQLKLGIRAGEELLEKFSRAPFGVPTWFQRIYTSGVVQVSLGGAICFLVAFGVAKALHIE